MIEEWETKTMQALTDEERQKLVERLRTSEGSYQSLHATMDVAANEIELLSKELKSWKEAYVCVSRELIGSFEEGRNVRLENAAG